eukprot:535919-Pleurochrysis_carterae.AAC.1
MTESKALMDANKPPEPPPKDPLLESFANGKGFMPPPARPPAAPFTAVSTEQVSGEGVPPPRCEPSDYEQVSEAELD